MRWSAKPFFPAPLLAEACSDEGVTLTFETISHWMSEKAISTTAQAGIKISVPRSGRSITPISETQNNQTKGNEIREREREFSQWFCVYSVMNENVESGEIVISGFVAVG